MIFAKKDASLSANRDPVNLNRCQSRILGEAFVWERKKHIVTGSRRFAAMVRLGMVSLLLLWCQFFTRETSASPPPTNCTAYCKYYVQCMCGNPLPATDKCIACITEHKATFSDPKVLAIPCCWRHTNTATTSLARSSSWCQQNIRLPRLWTGHQHRTHQAISGADSQHWNCPRCTPQDFVSACPRAICS